MKKILSFVLVLTLLVGLVPLSAVAEDTPTWENPFKDVASGIWYEKAVGYMNLNGYISGTSSNTFSPEETTTRAMFVTILGRMIGIDKTTYASKYNFSDNAPDWAKGYIAWASENGIAAGVGNNKFDPYGKITREQAATFLYRYAKKNGAAANDLSVIKKFPDALKVDSYAIEPFAWAVENKIINGSDGKLLPGGKATRSQIAQIFVNYEKFSGKDVSVVINGKEDDSSEGLTAEQISKKCSPAVFYIDIFALNGNSAGSGSGFFISSDGYAITNFHVAANSRKLEVVTSNGKRYKDVQIIDSDKKNDLALIKVKGTGFSYLEIGDSASIKQGQTVFALGSPLGLDNTLSKGIISNVSRNVNGTNYIQISVPIAPGSSGGALLNESGKVVGVTTAGFVNSTGDLNLAIPSARIKALSKSSDVDPIIWKDTFYPGFSKAYDFGAFTGVNLLTASATPLGYYCKYDAFDFHDCEDYDASSNYAVSIVFYQMALENNGFVKDRSSTSTNFLYTSKEERVTVLVDLNKEGIIHLLVERIPKYYSEFSVLPDLGWYFGLNLEARDEYPQDKAVQYSYKWSNDYTMGELTSTLELYFELLDELGYKYTGVDSHTYLFEGNGLSVIYMISNTMIYVDIAPLKR